jgi:hypothetical protein
MQNTETREDAVRRSREVNTRGALIFAFWLAAGTIVVAVAMYGLFRAMQKKEDAADRPLAPAVAASLQRTPPEPRLEAMPLVPRQKLHAEEDAVLTSYAWVDKPGGFVRIPVDRAMELLVSEACRHPSRWPPRVPCPCPAPRLRPPPLPRARSRSDDPSQLRPSSRAP